MDQLDFDYQMLVAGTRLEGWVRKSQADDDSFIPEIYALTHQELADVVVCATISSGHLLVAIRRLVRALRERE